MRGNPRQNRGFFMRGPDTCGSVQLVLYTCCAACWAKVLRQISPRGPDDLRRALSIRPRSRLRMIQVNAPPVIRDRSSYRICTPSSTAASVAAVTSSHRFDNRSRLIQRIISTIALGETVFRRHGLIYDAPGLRYTVVPGPLSPAVMLVGRGMTLDHCR
jgi:hypothetical protein